MNWLWGVLAAPVTGVVIWVLRQWISEQIRAGADEAVKKRLAALQLDLDKELERHRSELQASAEVLRASLSKSTTDFAIYAQRKHDAVAGLFAGILENVDVFYVMIQGIGPPESDVATLAKRAPTARNGAGHAYFRHALYLTEELDNAAREVLETVDSFAADFLLGEPITEKSRSKLETLQQQMERLQLLSRAELSRATDTPRASFPAHTIAQTITKGLKKHEGPVS